MTFSTPKSKNYSAVICVLDKLVSLENCDNVQSTFIFGNSVIISKDAQSGDIGLFFPVETALSKEFLGTNNLYRKPEWGNLNSLQKGYFEEHGRVKAIKFRGHKSEGFWIPLNCLNYLNLDLTKFFIGAEFDKIDGHEICFKYVPRGNSHSSSNGNKKQGRQPRVKDKLVEGQFRFHVDTEQLGRNIHKISPDDYISISSKWHGTSAIFTNILIKKTLPWYERILQWIGVGIQDQEYGYAWSSRHVVKGVAGVSKSSIFHYYGTDIWGMIAEKIKSQIPKGITIYGEIVGYTPGGGGIQKAKNGKVYHYECSLNNNKLVIYRVTITNVDGKVIEFSWLQMKEFCVKYGFEMVKEFYYGKAGDFGNGYSVGTDLRDWRDQFLKEVQGKYAPDEMCPYNNMEVPLEGVVVRIDHLEEVESYKLKSFLFKKQESEQLDAGVLDLETEQTEQSEEVVS